MRNKEIWSRLFIVMISVVFLTALVFSGCGEESETNTTKTEGTSVEDTSAVTPDTPGDTGTPLIVDDDTLSGEEPDFFCHYKADFVQKYYTEGKWETLMEGSVWNNCDAIRTEAIFGGGDMHGGEVSPIVFRVIQREDLGVSWTLYPTSKKYTEEEMTDIGTFAMFDINSLEDLEGYNVKEVGKETIDGHACTKYEIALIDTEEEFLSYYAWAANDLENIIVKIEITVSEGEMMAMELTDIEVGRQPDELFELPPDYTLATDEEADMLMMQEMMGNMPMPEE